MSAAILNVIADQWPALAFTVLGLLLIYCGGFWRFCVRTFATMAALCMALSTFASLMDNATSEWLGKSVEALRELARQAARNRRAALAEMGERV